MTSDIYGINAMPNSPLYSSEASLYPWTVPPQWLLNHESGIVFGSICGKLVGLKESEEGNVLLIGSPGSGKSSSIIEPTLGSWKGPFLTLDIKGELEAYYRAHGQNERKIVVLDPNDWDGLSVDPFEWLDDDGPDELLSNVTALASIFIPTDRCVADPFWTESERAVLTAAILFCYKAGLSFSQAIVRILDLSLSELCQEISKIEDVNIRHLIGGLSGMKAETVCSIERGLRNKLLQLSNEENLLHFFRGKRECSHVFSFRDLEKAAVFVRIPQEKVDRWGAGVVILLTMLLRYLEHRPEKNSAAGKNIAPFLVVIDELPRFGRLPMLTSALATLRSKKVNILMATQSLSQLDSIYGTMDRATILDCCTYRVILRVADPQNQRLIADMLGTYPQISPSTSMAYDRSWNLCGFGMQLGVQRGYIIQPSDLAWLSIVAIATPFGNGIIEKLPPSNCSDVQLLEDGVLSKDVIRCSKEVRSDTAKSLVEAFLQEAYSGISSAWPDCVPRLGSLLCRYFPELLATGKDLRAAEKIMRVLAADTELLNALNERAQKLRD